MKLVIAPGKLMVEEFPDQEKTSSGLYVTSDPDRSPYEGHGTVLEVGGPKKYSDGTQELSEFAPGDEVYYSNTTSHQVTIEGRKYLIIKDEAVIVKVEK
jgi:co-chaperonin GroES (HSP10)